MRKQVAPLTYSLHSPKIFTLATRINTRYYPQPYELGAMEIFPGDHCQLDEPATAGGNSLSQDVLALGWNL